MRVMVPDNAGLRLRSGGKTNVKENICLRAPAQFGLNVLCLRTLSDANCTITQCLLYLARSPVSEGINEHCRQNNAILVLEIGGTTAQIQTKNMGHGSCKLICIYTQELSS